MEGHNHSGYILTLCERKSRFLVLRVLRSKHAEEVANQIIKGLRKYKTFTITYDNGTECTKHERVNEKLGCKSIFCAPYHSWEKGAVENSNGLTNIRQYHKVSESFETLSLKEVNKTTKKLNKRPNGQTIEEYTNHCSIVLNPVPGYCA